MSLEAEEVRTGSGAPPLLGSQPLAAGDALEWGLWCAGCWAPEDVPGLGWGPLMDSWTAGSVTCGGAGD